MKIASYNIQNLFHRNRSLVEKNFSKNVSNWFSELDALMKLDNHCTGHRERIQELLFLVGFEKSHHTPYAVMRKRGGFLYFKSKPVHNEFMANELTNWNGWTALKTQPINEIATKNKARVIADVNADILILQEVEDRYSWNDFNAQYLSAYDMELYDNAMLISGRADLGLENGVAVKRKYSIERLAIHAYRDVNEQPVEFYEYHLKSNTGQRIVILLAQLQETTTDKDLSDKIRKAQAQELATIYKSLTQQGFQEIIVTGTFNAVSYCDSLSPLLRETDLKDITKHESFDVDIDLGQDASYFRMGAYRMGVNIKQKDYMLLSPKLFANVKIAGLNRQGVWHSKRPEWNIYPSIKNDGHAASSHPGAVV